MVSGGRGVRYVCVYTCVRVVVGAAQVCIKGVETDEGREGGDPGGCGAKGRHVNRTPCVAPLEVLRNRRFHEDDFLELAGGCCTPW